MTVGAVERSDEHDDVHLNTAVSHDGFPPRAGHSVRNLQVCGETILGCGLSCFCFSYVSKPRRMCPTQGSQGSQGGQGAELRRESRQLSLMSDRRVVRGNTYSGTISHHTTGGIQVKRTSSNHSRNNNRSLPSARLSQLGRDPLKTGARKRDGGRGRLTVPPVAGRRHQTLQTDHWLEEISDKREEKEMATQVNLSDDWEQGGTKLGKRRIELDNKINMEDKVNN